MQIKRVAVVGIFFAALAGLWWAAVASGRWSAVLLPSPLDVADYLWAAARDGTMISAVYVTMQRLLIGYVIGLIIGLQLTANPFVLYPSYREIAHLPLAERVAEMRKPEVRARILADKPGHGHPILYAARMWDWIFPLGDTPDYEPDPSTSIGARARARGVSPTEEAYDRMLDDDGRAMLLVATSNLANNSLDTVGELLHRDDVVLLQRRDGAVLLRREVDVFDRPQQIRCEIFVRRQIQQQRRRDGAVVVDRQRQPHVAPDRDRPKHPVGLGDLDLRHDGRPGQFHRDRLAPA